jgi:hypothetical protein
MRLPTPGRNIGYPNTKISVRVDSDVDNACYGLGPFVTLTVENPLQILFQFHDNAMTTKMAFFTSIKFRINFIRN